MSLLSATIAGLVAAGLGLLGTWLSPRWLEETRPRPRDFWAVGLLGLLIGGAIGYIHGPSGTTWQYSVLTGALLTASLVDLKERIIPNEVVLATLALSLLLQLIAPNGTWPQALIGLGFGFGVLLLLALLYKGGMGFGDVKLMAAIGFVLTWKSDVAFGYYPTAVQLLISFILGGVISMGLIVTRKVGRKDAIPFGPFLAVGAIITMLWGAPLMHWYLGV